MLTLRTAASLLSGANTIDDLAPIAAAVGCAGPTAALDAESRRSLGLGADVVDCRVAAGKGALRAMMVVANEAPLRDLCVRLAARLATRASHALWIVIASQRNGSEVGIACWRSDRRPPRIALLVADKAHVVDSDAETLCTLSAAGSEDDLMTHARWLDALGREALSKRFFRTLERIVGELATSARGAASDARHDIALLYVSRLLFLAFLEAKGWLDDDRGFLARAFDGCMATGGHFHRRVLRPLFFGTLNTPPRRRAASARAFGVIPFLNGGLFTPSGDEKRHRRIELGDEAFGALFGELFAHYRFTAREETTSMEEAAIDPEMLGRAFESLMAAGTRRTSGAFYTPQELVARVSTLGLHSALSTSVGEHLATRVLEKEPLADDERDRARTALSSLTVLDPACGSGAFLVHALDRITDLRRSLGDPHPPDVVRRETLSQAIFGVDVNPTAVWLCELRLWLAVVIESAETDPTRVPPLPNLDRNIRVGDSLAGADFRQAPAARSQGGIALWHLRRRYARSTGTRKRSLARALDREERRLVLQSLDAHLGTIRAVRRDLVAARRGRDLFGGRYAPSREELRRAADLRSLAAGVRSARRRVARGGALPFSFPAQFADVAARGGFSLIVGNPPWVRPHRLGAHVRENFRRDYQVARAASWAPGALAAGAGTAFGAQVDVAALFVERSMRLLEPRGSLSFLLPAKLWRSLAGGGVRRLLASDAEVVRVEDYSDAPPSFDASVYPGLLVARARPHTPGASVGSPVTVSVVPRERESITWEIAADRLAWDDSAGAPWLLIPPPVRRAFDILRTAGVSLAESPIGRPYLGVKCGYNDAFVVRRAAGDDECDEARIVDSAGDVGRVERRLLRPVIRGQDVAAWRTGGGDEWIIWTHDPAGTVMPELPALAARWFARSRRMLSARTDLREPVRWWSLFRTEGARGDRTRVVWSDLARAPRAAVIPACDTSVPLNTCYIVRGRDDDDAFAFAAFLNSPLAAAWLDVLAEPARGGYRRFLGWTVALLPVPLAWDDVRAPLAAVGREATRDPTRVTPAALLDASLEAFSLRRADIAPLLAWSNR